MYPIPYTAVHPTETNVLLALIEVHRRDRRATVRAVAEEAGIAPSSAYLHLTQLRRRGLVAWESAANVWHRTLRPLVAPVG